MFPSTGENNNPVDVSSEKEVGTTELSAQDHTRLLRKLDWNLLPLVSFLYLLAFLWVVG